MLIKKKSVAVAVISSVVIGVVMVLTLVGYAMYLELKDEESKGAYMGLLQKINARFYAAYIEISKLNGIVENSGALTGKPIVEGVIRNTGYKNVTDILLKVRFLDRDGAIIYEVSFHPFEPALGSASLARVAMPYLADSPRVNLGPEESIPFKRILPNCPKEILEEIGRGSPSAKGGGRWSGTFDYEIMAVTF